MSVLTWADGSRLDLHADLERSAAAIAEFGEDTDYAAWFRDPGDARRLLLAARDGAVAWTGRQLRIP